MTPARARPGPHQVARSGFSVTLTARGRQAARLNSSGG